MKYCIHWNNKVKLPPELKKSVVHQNRAANNNTFIESDDLSHEEIIDLVGTNGIVGMVPDKSGVHNEVV